MYIVRSLASLGALVGGVALLLADDAGPQCEIVSFDRTFQVSSSCGPVTEIVRITGPVEVGTKGTFATSVVEHVSGDTLVTASTIQGTCNEDDAPLDYTQFGLDLDLPAPDGYPRAHHCSVQLDTLTADCGIGACTVTVTAPQ